MQFQKLSVTITEFSFESSILLFDADAASSKLIDGLQRTKVLDTCV